jgi:hypothetical protein
MSDIGIRAGVPGSSSGRMQSICGRDRGLQEPGDIGRASGRPQSSGRALRGIHHVAHPRTSGERASARDPRRSRGLHRDRRPAHPAPEQGKERRSIPALVQVGRCFRRPERVHRQVLDFAREQHHHSGDRVPRREDAVHAGERIEAPEADVWFVGQALDRIVQIAERRSCAMRSRRRRSGPALLICGRSVSPIRSASASSGRVPPRAARRTSGEDRAAPAPSPRSARRRPATRLSRSPILPPGRRTVREEPRET